MKDQKQTASEVKNSSSAGKLASVVRRNKQGLVMFVMAVARQGGAMGAETIKKNGRSSKSQTSRVNNIKE